MIFGKKLKVLDKFRRKEDVLITFEDLEGMPLNKTLQMVEGSDDILCTRIVNNKGNLSFRVEMEKGKYWQRHHHDCEETIIVYKGKLIDEVNGKESCRLVPMEISKDQVHFIKGLESSEFYVEFKRP